jgi:putative transposase
VPGATSTDQRRQSIAKDFIDGLREHQIGISVDGRGRSRDNVFVERPWKTIRCQPVDHRTARCRAGPFTF